MSTKGINEWNLKFQELHVHFTYSFIFDPSNWGSEKFSELGFSKGTPRERLGWMPSRTSSNAIDNHKFIRLKAKEVSSKLAVEKIDNPSEEKYQYDVRMVSCNNQLDNLELCFDTMISTTVRLRRSGLGSIVVCLQLEPKANLTNPELDFFDIESLLRFTPSTWEQMINNKMYDGSSPDFLTLLSIREGVKEKLVFSLSQYYYKTLEWIKNTGIVKELQFDRAIPKQVFKSDDYLFGIYNPSKLSEKLKTLDFGVINEHSVHPYIHITAKLPANLYQEMFLEDNEILQNAITRPLNDADAQSQLKCDKIKFSIRTKQISALLFRFFDFKQHEFISSRYIRKELDCCERSSEPVLLSHNANSKFFTHIYRMASVSFYNEDKGIPFEVISKSLFDVVENARAKYFGIQVANSLLDSLIYSINYIGAEENENYEYEYLINPLLHIEKFIAFSVADPSIMLLDGHVAFDILELVFEKMKINNTNKKLIEKLELVRKLIEDSRSSKYINYVKNM